MDLVGYSQLGLYQDLSSCNQINRRTLYMHTITSVWRYVEKSRPVVIFCVQSVYTFLKLCTQVKQNWVVGIFVSYIAAILNCKMAAIIQGVKKWTYPNRVRLIIRITKCIVYSLPYMSRYGVWAGQRSKGQDSHRDGTWPLIIYSPRPRVLQPSYLESLSRGGTQVERDIGDVPRNRVPFSPLR